MNNLQKPHAKELATALQVPGAPVVGLLEWFRVGEYENVEKTLAQLKALGINELRTGVSWADYYTQEGQQWYDWLVPYLSKEVSLLPCFLYTPPSIGLKPKTSAPPRNPKDYADFLDVFVNKHSKYIEWVELWNEPNNRSEYDFTLDTNWTIFSEMIGGAAYWMKQLGKKTLLGGMSPIDPNWLEMMRSRNVLQYIDAIGIHGFPEVFDSHWAGWEVEVARIQAVVEKLQHKPEIWITETGFSTWQHDEQKQLAQFLNALKAPVERLYWYAANDLNPNVNTVDGFHQDEREYFFGMNKVDGTPKLLYRLLADRKVENIQQDAWMAKPYITASNKEAEHVVITGGAGFIGTNLADRFLSEGKKVTILDNLSRPGVEKNARWLHGKHQQNLSIQVVDILNKYAVNSIISTADVVYHFAAQVAVTTSCTNPMNDFEINARGTMHVLEAIRQRKTPIPLIFTSTNKVYGGLEDVKLVMQNNRYVPEDESLLENGIGEARSIDFHSPYGCSKGAADQYILDYARTYNIPTVVFRMSCIYGPHQYGNEDQGWVAHFLIRALENKPITLYGDGKQVRDILYVEDLVDAFILAKENIHAITGQAFNIGGGTDNSISLLELISIIEEIKNEKIDLHFGDWRIGDQLYYVSDTRKFSEATGWTPKVSYKQGIEKLFNWLLEARGIKIEKQVLTEEALK